MTDKTDMIPRAEAEAMIAAALEQAAAICDEERHNLNMLTSDPPQSAAAVAAARRIRALIQNAKDPATSEGDGAKEE